MSREYRKSLGFSSQKEAGKFLTGKDISASIDSTYLDALANRLCDITGKVNSLLNDGVKCKDIEDFTSEHIIGTLKKMKDNGIVSQINNFGRRPEYATFSWLRGYAMIELFLPTIEYTFDSKKVEKIGEDNLDDIASFKRAPTADLEVDIGAKKIRVEVQSGFKGVNDIKLHKFEEADRIFECKKRDSYLLHFDVYNGQVALVRLNGEKENRTFETRQQMEGQEVTKIDPNEFLWLIEEEPKKLNDLDI